MGKFSHPLFVTARIAVAPGSRPAAAMYGRVPAAMNVIYNCIILVDDGLATGSTMRAAVVDSPPSTGP
jgi:hypothetical protein